MATQNDVTGDQIKSKPVSDRYRDNYDAIFRKDKKDAEGDREKASE